MMLFDLEIFRLPDQLNFARVLVFEQRSYLVLINVFCIDGYSCLRYRNEFFSAVFQALDWTFLVLHFYGNVCNWIPKVIWPRMDWFWGFCWKMASFVDFISVWTKICTNCSIVILFWRHQIFSMFSLRGILVCSLKMLVLLSHRVF